MKTAEYMNINTGFMLDEQNPCFFLYFHWSSEKFLFYHNSSLITNHCLMIFEIAHFKTLDNCQKKVVIAMVSLLQ